MRGRNLGVEFAEGEDARKRDRKGRREGNKEGRRQEKHRKEIGGTAVGGGTMERYGERGGGRVGGGGRERGEVRGGSFEDA